MVCSSLECFQILCTVLIIANIHGTFGNIHSRMLTHKQSKLFTHISLVVETESNMSIDTEELVNDSHHHY